MPGALPSKSNSRRIVRRGNSVASIKSAESIQYVHDFLRLFKREQKTLTGELALSVIVQQKDMRRDLDVALLMDCLQHAGIIENDRQIWRIRAERKLARDLEPQTSFSLTKFFPTQGPNRKTS